MQRGPESFERFVTDSGPSLFRTACLLTGDPGEADDLLQDALERVLRRWGRSTITDPERYVRTTMVNLLRSRWRPRRVRVVPVAEVPEDPRMGFEAPDAVVGDRGELLLALRQITKKQRMVVVLRYWLDLSEAATAELAGCSVGTVKSQASRGLRNLRELLEPSQLPIPAVSPARMKARPQHGNH